MINKIAILFFSLSLFSFELKAQWSPANNGITNHNINTVNGSGFIGYMFAGNDQFTYRSLNGGVSWQQNLNLPALDVAFGNYIYMSNQNGIWRSSNYGNNWSSFSFNQWTNVVLPNGNVVYAGCSGSSTNRGVWISSDYGFNFAQTTLNYIDVRSLTFSGGYLFAGGYNTGAGGVFVSTNNGQTWTNPLLIAGDALASNGNIIYAGDSSTGVYKSTNYGANWTQTSVNNGIHTLLVNGISVFAGGEGFWVSSDNGTTWVQRIEGLGGEYVTDICIYNDFIYAATYGKGIFRRWLYELVGIQPISNSIPTAFQLGQNFPNPFNPVTNIRFSVSKRSFIKLQVYDILGRLKDDIVNNELSPAEYEVIFDGSAYPSGVYLYRLIADNKTIGTKKLILLK